MGPGFTRGPGKIARTRTTIGSAIRSLLSGNRVTGKDARPVGERAKAESRGRVRRLGAPAPPPRVRFGAPPAAARSQRIAGRTTDSSACLIRRSAVIFDCVGLRAVVTRPRVKVFASTPYPSEVGATCVPQDLNAGQ